MDKLTQGPFTIDPTGTQVTIGEGHSAGNRLELGITNTGETASVRVTLEVQCGHTETALLFATTVAVTATCLSGDTRQALTATNINGGLRWQTGQFGIDLDKGRTLKISLTGFESNTCAGEATISVKVEIEKDDDFEEVGGSHQLKVSKASVATPDPKIHHFTVAPDYLLNAGRDEVTVGFHATGFESFVLYRNNREVANWPNNQVKKNPDGSLTGTFLDRPSITTAYRLEGKPGAQNAGNLNIERIRYRTVQVISDGWNQIALPQGYPARLFVNTDFRGSGMDRLFGIFIDRNGRAALYSSVTGIDEWRLEPGEVPGHMGKSPGVAFDNQLWLIGGSCVDTDDPGNEVWCYEEDPRTKERRWNKKPSFPAGMPARAGHACVVFPRQQGKTVAHELWVIGGFINGEVLGDVWKLAEGATWVPIRPSGAAWPARHGHAAVSFTPAPGEKAEVWIYGGKGRSENQTDLWSTIDGETWKQERGIVPAPGLPLGAALAASEVLPAATRQRLFLGGTFLEPDASGGRPNRTSSFIFEWQWRNQIWEARPVEGGWERFEGSRFYMQAVAFNRFLFVWSLGSDDEATVTPKLNILISR